MKIQKNKIFIIILLFLLILSNFTNVFGASYDNSNIEDEVLNTIKGTEYYNNQKYGMACFYLVNLNQYRLFIFDKELYSDFYFNIDLNSDNCYVLTFSNPNYRWSYIDINADGITAQSENNILTPTYRDTVSKLDCYYTYNCTVYLDGVQDFFFTELRMGKIMEQAMAQVIPTILKVIAAVVGLVTFLTALKTGFRVWLDGLWV